ncbi:dicarboxylate/amino acid:cation symporter [Sciscionella sediminilitoris]|uniref:dicarboxylate/amino acid:cation symporter n=1 Tax=Sciscionella sediminilitoris TaxID=1445613 RepID=UPI000690A516|nr:dicarboxylate/amino acid:cation symporter [Sciscionella sp. SE31]
MPERRGRTDESQDLPNRPRFPPLWAQILLALALGVLLGFLAPGFSEHIEIVGEAFIRLIQMSLLPLIFPLIVLAIARMDSAKTLGRLAGKSILYFEVVTTVIVVCTVGVAAIAGFGSGVHLPARDAADTKGITKSLDAGQFILDIIPKNIFAALSEGNLLAVLLFAAFFGVALARIGEKAQPVLNVLDGVAEAMFRVVGWVARLAPIAVIAYVAYNTAHYGWDVLLDLALFVVVFYAACLLVLGVILPVVALVCRVPYFRMLAKAGDLVLLSFVTRSSEVVLAPLIARLERFGVSRKVSSFTMPLGYSFNADGATIYEGLAVVFLANAYGIELTPGRLVMAILVLMLLTKGIAGIPSASVVVLFSAATIIGLPAQGVAILLAVDFVVDMARTALNVTGNALAATVIAKSEKEFLPPPSRPISPTSC